MRFTPKTIELQGIPKKISREIFRTIQNGIAGRLGTPEPFVPVPFISPSVPTVVSIPQKRVETPSSMAKNMKFKSP